VLQPFAIRVAEEVLADLNARLDRVRWPDEAPDSGWAHGSSLAYMKELAEYWRHSYDWRTHEARLNRIPQFIAPIDGTDLHFIHVRGEGRDPLPLLLSHGWPGSIVEFERLIPMLTDPPATARSVGRLHHRRAVPAGLRVVHAPSARFNLTRIAGIHADRRSRSALRRRAATSRLRRRSSAPRMRLTIGIHVTLLWGPRESTPSAETDDERACSGITR
jgi:hypothetical protein